MVYPVYPLIKDERLSKPEPTQVNDMPSTGGLAPSVGAGVSEEGGGHQKNFDSYTSICSF